MGAMNLQGQVFLELTFRELKWSVSRLHDQIKPIVPLPQATQGVVGSTDLGAGDEREGRVWIDGVDGDEQSRAGSDGKDFSQPITLFAPALLND